MLKGDQNLEDCYKVAENEKASPIECTRDLYM